jgi:hypothetical protein
MDVARRPFKHIFITVTLFLLVYLFLVHSSTLSITGHLQPKLKVVTEDEFNMEGSDRGHFIVIFLDWMDRGECQLR